MFWDLGFIFFLLLLANVGTDAHPTRPKSLISVTLTKVHLHDSANEHPVISHQRAVNRGLRRYARMAGNPEPTIGELRKNMIDRVFTIPPAELEKRFYRGGVNTILEYLNLNRSNLLTGTHSAGDHAQSLDTTVGSTSGSGSISLAIEGHDIGYMGIFEIGTPPRKFQLLVDSGSADLWVGAEGCQADDGGSCGNHSFLGPNSSSTYKDLNQTWSIQYGTGAVTGRIVQDSISMAGLNLPAKQFGVALNESSEFTSDFIPFDGLLGLCKWNILSRQGVPTLVDDLYSAGLIPQPITSYKLPRFTDNKNDGELTFGGMDPSKFDVNTLVTVKNKSRLGFWEAALDSVHVNGVDMGWTNRTLILDTGTTLIIAPAKDVAALHGAIPDAKKDGHTWTVPCTLTTPVVFTIGGMEFPIDHSDIAFMPVDQNNATGTCMSGISEGNPGLVDTQWLIGDVFLKNVYMSTNVATDEISLAIPT